MIEATEVQPGLVLHLDPDVLEEEGGRYTCSRDRRVRGPHFFLVTGRDEQEVVVLPLYTEDGVGRVELGRRGRTGHFKWVRGKSSYHPEQIWAVPVDAVVLAADAGGDLSTSTMRNRLAVGEIPPDVVRMPEVKR